MPANREAVLQSRESARSSSPVNFDQKLKEALAANASLEKEKFRLMEAIAKDKKLVGELEQQITILNAQVVERKIKLASYNALFLRMKDADIKAPKQRFGLRDAVLGTKRVIEKELDRLAKEAVATELKLNRAKDKNNVLRAQINTFRREHVTFRSLFEQMQQELAEVKKSIQETESSIENGYQQRSRAHEEMKEVLRQFEQDRLERQQDWNAATLELENAGTIVATRPPEGQQPPGGRKGQNGTMLSPAEQEHLKRKIVRGQTKIQKDRAALHFHQKKAAAFVAALERIKERTGHSRTQEIVSLFNALEERKFSRARIAQRLVAEIERLEQETSQLRGEVQDRELENARLKADRVTAISQLQTTAMDFESQVTEVNESARVAFNEIKALFRVVEFTFRSLGVQSALNETGAIPSSPGGHVESYPLPSPGKWPGGPDSPVAGSARTPFMRAESTVSLSEFREKPSMAMFGAASPLSPDSSSRMSMRRQGSIGMYTGSATQTDALRSGVSAGSLGMYVGIIENKAAEILQQFAVAATRGELVTESDLDRLEGMDEAALMAHEAAIREGKEVDLPMEGDLRPISADVLGMSMAQRQQLRRRSAAFAAGSGEMARRILLPGGLGPSEPPGKIRETIATSALVASLAMDSQRILAGEDTLGDDDARPVPVEELKEEALRRLLTDKSIRALKTAAGAAAAALIAAGPSAPMTATGSSMGITVSRA